MCPAVSPPPLPILPTPTQDPILRILVPCFIFGIPYGIYAVSKHAQGFARTVGTLCIVLLMLAGLIGAVTLNLYHDSWFAMFLWRDQMYQQQCPTSSVDAAYSHALTQIQPIHSVYQIAQICFISLFFVWGGFLFYLWWQRQAARRNG